MFYLTVYYDNNAWGSLTLLTIFAIPGMLNHIKAEIECLRVSPYGAAAQYIYIYIYTKLRLMILIILYPSLYLLIKDNYFH